MTEDKTERFKELQKQAKTGNTEAMYNLAHAYRKGEGTEQDLEQFFHWTRRAAEAGIPEAMYLLAIAYRNGMGTEKDVEQYFNWTKKAAEADIPEAIFPLALAYMSGYGTEKDLEKFFHWVEKAAGVNNPNAMFFLSFAYKEGKGTQKDPKQFFHWIEKAAKADDRDAMLVLSLAYKESEGTEQDLEQYFQWTKKAAEANYPEAMFNLALAYKKSEGTEQDLEQYFQWTKKAAEANYPEAMFNLAYAYREGEGTEENLSQYFHWTKKAAEADFPLAMLSLAVAYGDGEGTEKDLNQYFEWMEKAYTARAPDSFIAFPIVRLLHTNILDESQHKKILKALTDITKKCEAILKQHREDDEIKFSHYTKFSALNNILQGGNSNHLRLYNVAYFNDPLEGMSLPNAFGDGMCEFFYGDKDAISHEIEAGGKLFSVYVCAFTANEDRLDMWRAYGNNGDGYSITSMIPDNMKADEEHGFAFQMHDSILSSLQNVQDASPESDAPKDDDKISIYKVRYGDVAEETFKSLKEPLNTLKDILEGIDNEEVSQTAKAVAIQILADLRYLYKDKEYKSEDEYRIIRVIEAGNEKLKCDETSQPPRFYMETLPFLFQEEGCKITIGPRVIEKAATKIYIEQYLHKNNWGTTKVVHSKIKYR